METLFEYLNHFHYFGLFVALFLCEWGSLFPKLSSSIAGGFYVLESIKPIPTLLILWSGRLAEISVFTGLADDLALIF